MNGKTFLARIAVIATSFICLCVLLWLILGQRTFSYYGVATAGLLALPFLAKTLTLRAKQTGRRRWPSILMAVLLAIIALGQICFWLTFFHGGDIGMSFGLIRAVASSAIADYIGLGAAILGGVLLWIIGRLTR